MALFDPDAMDHLSVNTVRLPGCGCCVTVIVRAARPGTVTLSVPVLGVLVMLVLASAFSLNEPLPVRLVGCRLVTVSHGTVLDTFHCLLDVTVTVVLFALDVMFHVLIERLRDGGGVAAWVTVIVRCTPPAMDTVTVPVLEIVPVLSDVFILKEPIPVRFAGDIVLIVNQNESLLTFHWTLDVTFIVAELARWDEVQPVCDTVNVGCGYCLTAMVRVIPPVVVETDTVPVLTAAPWLAAAFIQNEPLPVRLGGEMLLKVSQVTLLDTFHCVLDDTVTGALAAAAATTHPVIPNSVNVGAGGGGGAACVTVTVRVMVDALTLMVPVLDVVPVLAVAFILNEPFCV